ncbi:MAG: hypothetical protein ACP6IU_07515 [Candidatus Asgardarchaeia archaeon]
MISIFFLAFLLSLVSFVLSLFLHRKRLSNILELSDLTELSKAEYLRQPYLAVANFFFILTLMFFVLAIYWPQISFDVVINPVLHFSYIKTSHESNLVVDVILVCGFTSLFSIIYPLIKKQNSLVDFSRFVIGFMFGLAFSLLMLPTYGLGGLLFLIMLFFFVFLSENSLISVAGAIFGYFFLVVFVYSTSIFELIILWLAIMLMIGILLGIFLVMKFDKGLLFVLIFMCFPVLYYFGAGYDITMTLVFLAGLVLFLNFIYELTFKFKAALVALFVIAFYLADGLAHSFVFGVAFIVGLSIGLFLIAELYKNAIRSVLSKWILLSMRSKNDKIDLSGHESVSSFKNRKIKRKSYLFTWLDHLILRPLLKHGFMIELVEEEENGERYLRNIFGETQNF